MPVPANALVRKAQTMGELSRRQRVTRADAEKAIRGFAFAWGVAHNDRAEPSSRLVDDALRAYAVGRGARFSASQGPRLPLSLPLRLAGRKVA
jgi:hypothetical protein